MSESLQQRLEEWADELEEQINAFPPGWERGMAERRQHLADLRAAARALASAPAGLRERDSAFVEQHADELDRVERLLAHSVGTVAISEELARVLVCIRHAFRNRASNAALASPPVEARQVEWVVSQQFHAAGGWYVHRRGANRPGKSPLFETRELAERVAEWANRLAPSPAAADTPVGVRAPGLGVDPSGFDPTCQLAGPGRGDCTNYKKGPEDAYGRPENWCWWCWQQEKIRKLERQLEIARTAVAAWQDEAMRAPQPTGE